MIDDIQAHRMMKWAFIDLPKCTLETDGTIKTINFTKIRNDIDEIHSYGTRTIGFHIHQPNIFPEVNFTIDGIIYNKTSYSSAPSYDQTWIEYMSLFENELKNHSYINYFGENISWFDEIYMNSHDELQVRTQDIIDEVTEEHDWLKNTVGMTIPIMQTLMGSTEYPQIQANIDIICIHTMGFEPAYITEWKESGKEVWIYTTRGPRFPSPSLSTAGFATQIRALGWQCWIQNYSQYLIWDIATPLNAMGGYGYQGWNGGSLLYTSSTGYDISTRMELIREGFEDHDYFYLLNRNLKILQNTDPNNSKIATGLSLLNKIDNLIIDETPIMDYRIFNSLRIEIAEYIEDFN